MDCTGDYIIHQKGWTVILLNRTFLVKTSDFDVIKDYSEAVDGDITAWNKMISMANAGLMQNEAYQLIQGKNPDGTSNPELEAMVDVVSLADYMILNFYAGNWDWDHHNWVAIRNRVTPGRGFQFFTWDAEHTVESLTANILSENNDKMPKPFVSAVTSE